MSDSPTLFVTGAASGIGRATAKRFVEGGWRVGLHDLDSESVEALAGELGTEQARAGRLDVTDYAECVRAVESFGEWTSGRMDALFLSAGVLRMGRFEDLPIEEHVRTYRVNVLGIVHAIHAAFALLRDTPGAHVVSMGSASGIYGVPELATYSSSKFAVRGLTEALGIEFERHDIQVSDLMPPYVETPLISDQEYVAGTVKSLGVALRPEEIAELAWKAVHGKSKHWIPTARLQAMVIGARLFPFLEKPMMRYLSGLHR